MKWKKKGGDAARRSDFDRGKGEKKGREKFFSTKSVRWARKRGKGPGRIRPLSRWKQIIREEGRKQEEHWSIGLVKDEC